MDSLEAGHEVGVSNVEAHPVDLPCCRASRVDSEALLLQGVGEVDVEQALVSINTNTDTSANLKLSHGDQAAASCSKLKDTLSRLEVGELERKTAVRCVRDGAEVVAANQGLERVVDLVGGAEVHHGGRLTAALLAFGCN